MTKKALIIDDEEQIHRLLKKTFEKSVHELIFASSGEEGYHLAVSEKPDLILLDVSMPGWNGYQTAKKLRSNDATKDIPIVMLTGNADPIDRATGFEMGVQDYISKPFLPDDLLRRLSEFLTEPG